MPPHNDTAVTAADDKLIKTFTNISVAVGRFYERGAHFTMTLPYTPSE